MVWFPPFAYYRGLWLLTGRTYFWSEVFVDELGSIFGFLFLETLLCVAATVYFDQVLPKEYGVRRHPLFCIRDPVNYLIINHLN